ncbi:hypothetical protein HPB50_018890 [Hyalomma asiaticum]|uniref:Uncharacterized protein n=1 Tax=Hyalomma asiaticum TaxID=266040 RepID=A0ACB7TMN6_HYAAI|nr:hypothetical protein HPB50_018890 [Hyalomma asiaticum]
MPSWASGRVAALDCLRYRCGCSSPGLDKRHHDSAKPQIEPGADRLASSAERRDQARLIERADQWAP